jgi:hypothetical protein
MRKNCSDLGTFQSNVMSRVPGQTGKSALVCVAALEDAFGVLLIATHADEYLVQRMREPDIAWTFMNMCELVGPDKALHVLDITPRATKVVIRLRRQLQGHTASGMYCESSELIPKLQPEVQLFSFHKATGVLQHLPSILASMPESYTGACLAVQSTMQSCASRIDSLRTECTKSYGSLTAWPGPCECTYYAQDLMCFDEQELCALQAWSQVPETG